MIIPFEKEQQINTFLNLNRQENSKSSVTEAELNAAIQNVANLVRDSYVRKSVSNPNIDKVSLSVLFFLFEFSWNINFQWK